MTETISLYRHPEFKSLWKLNYNYLVISLMFGCLGYNRTFKITILPLFRNSSRFFFCCECFFTFCHKIVFISRKLTIMKSQKNIAIIGWFRNEPPLYFQFWKRVYVNNMAWFASQVLWLKITMQFLLYDICMCMSKLNVQK